MTLRHRRPPSGYALIECLVLISVMTVLLGLCAGTIRLLMKLDRAGRSARDQAADIRRLSEDFRADAHAALADPPRPEAGDRLSLALPGGRAAEYQGRPASIVRTVREGDRVRRTETYRRPPKTTLRFEVAAEGSKPMAALIIDPAPGSGDESPDRDWRIEAELGKDRRFSARAK